MNRLLIPLLALSSILFAPVGAQAKDLSPNRAAGHAEYDLTKSCTSHQPGCRADGYPDARDYRARVDGGISSMYRYNDRPYYAPSGLAHKPEAQESLQDAR